MDKRDHALTSGKDLPPPRLVKVTEDDRLERALSSIIEEELATIKAAEEDVFYIKHALIAIRKLLKEERINRKNGVAEIVYVMEERLGELKELIRSTKDIDLNSIQ